MYRKNFPSMKKVKREGALERLQLQLTKDPNNKRIQEEIATLKERIKTGVQL